MISKIPILKTPNSSLSPRGILELRRASPIGQSMGDLCFGRQENANHLEFHITETVHSRFWASIGCMPQVVGDKGLSRSGWAGCRQPRTSSWPRDAAICKAVLVIVMSSSSLALSLALNLKSVEPSVIPIARAVYDSIQRNRNKHADSCGNTS